MANPIRGRNGWVKHADGTWEKVGTKVEHRAAPRAVPTIRVKKGKARSVPAPWVDKPFAPPSRVVAHRRANIERAKNENGGYLDLRAFNAPRLVQSRHFAAGVLPGFGGVVPKLPKLAKLGNELRLKLAYERARKRHHEAEDVHARVLRTMRAGGDDNAERAAVDRTEKAVHEARERYESAKEKRKEAEGGLRPAALSPRAQSFRSSPKVAAPAKKKRGKR